MILGFLILVYAFAALVGVAGVIIGGLFSGLASAASWAFSGKGLVLGIVLGILIYYRNRRRNAD
jgi:hypothetical protein